jgi:hypothetical protein
LRGQLLEQLQKCFSAGKRMAHGSKRGSGRAARPGCAIRGVPEAAVYDVLNRGELFRG